MKVSNQILSKAQTKQNEAAKTQSDRVSLGSQNKSAAAAGKAGSVKVDFSTLASDIKKVKDMVDANTVDEAKVARFQNLIDSGNYKVDSAAVADRLLDEHLKMDI